MSGNNQIIGRIDDRRIIRGKGRFIDDIAFPGMLEVAFLRATEAHAKINKWDSSDALALPGVKAIYRFEDLKPALIQDRLPLQFTAVLPDNITPFVLADREIIYVGEPVALVVATSRYIAEDAVSRIVVDYESLPAIATCADALADNAPLVATDRTSNVIADMLQAFGDVEAAFAKAAGSVRLKINQHRGGAHPMEGRGVVAQRDHASGGLTFWSSTQMAHELRSVLVRMIGLDENLIRVIAPDIGGGFGAKYLVYAEEVAVAAAALIIGEPLKWIEDRREHFLAALQERDQHWDVEVCHDADGRLLGARGNLVHDQGAYTPQGVNIPFNSGTAFPGPYVLPAYHLKIAAVSTNKVPTSSVRGAGYPQGTFVMERALDAIADALAISRVEVRRRNLVQPDKMPYATPLQSRSGTSIVYDSGDFPKTLETALEEIEFYQFADRQAAAAAQGKMLGIGIACGIKGTGRGPYESGTVRIGASGTISIYTGASDMGQGIKTTLAHICARQFDVPPESIAVIAGDTATVPLGMGGFASRQTVTAGSSVHLAASKVRAKALRIASHLLEASEDDLEFKDGAVQVKGVGGLKVSLKQVAAAVYGSPGYSLPAGIDPGLESAEIYVPKGLTYGMGCHAVELLLDPVTCAPHIERYVVVNDAGVPINPDIIIGQIIGGVAHGIGNAMYERMYFDANAQPISTTFAEYLLPTSTEVPRIMVKPVVYPSKLNPIGVKGVGESGIVPAAAAIVSAIESAIGRPDVRILDIPLSPSHLFTLMHGGGSDR